MEITVSTTVKPPGRRQGGGGGGGNSQTGEQLYQRSSHAAVKVLSHTTDFPTWGFGKGTEYPQGI